MKKRVAQMAMEYVVMIGIVFMILIPGMLLFRNYISSSSDQIMAQRVNEIGNLIVNSAREIYYYGVPSKKVIQAELPEGVINIGTYFNAQGSGISDDEYILIITYLSAEGGMTTGFYSSDVPITVYNDASLTGCADNGDPVFTYSDSSTDCGKSNMEPSCAPGRCKCLLKKDYSKGKKAFKIEALKHSSSGITCPAGSGNCVTIDEVSNELACT